MSQEIHAVGAMRMLVETGTFGADQSADVLSSGIYVPASEGGTLTVTTAEHDTMHLLQSRVDGREFVNGKKSATLSFSMLAAPTGVPAGDGVTAVQGAFGKVLKATMGGEHLGTGTTFASGSTATVVNVTSAAGLIEGAYIGWVNAAGVMEYRGIKTIASNVVTLKRAFSAAPAQTDVCYATATYYFTEDPIENLQFLVEGAESDDRWLLTGGQAVGGVTFAIDPNGEALPTVTVNLQFADWLTSAETAATVTGALAEADYENYEPIVGFVGELRAFEIGVTTLSDASLVHCSEFSFNPKIGFVPVPSPAGKNGIKRWRASAANPPVEGTFSTFFEGLTWWTHRSAKTAMALQYTMGSAAGESLVFDASTVQISNPQRVAGGEIAGQTVAYRGRRDADRGAATSALARSAVRIVAG